LVSKYLSQCGHFFVYLIPSGFSKKWWLIEAGK